MARSKSSISAPIHQMRRSTTSLPNRDWILGLAYPDYQIVPKTGPVRRTRSTQQLSNVCSVQSVSLKSATSDPISELTRMRGLSSVLSVVKRMYDNTTGSVTMVCMPGTRISSAEAV